MMYSLDSLERPSARVIGGDGGDFDCDDDTVELELNESAMRALNEAAALALAAFEGRAEPPLTPTEANQLRTGSLEQETRAGERGPGALEREASAAREVSEAVELGAPAAKQTAEALEQGAPAARQAVEALEQEAPAARRATEPLEQGAAAPRPAGEALKQGTPAGSRGTVSVARAPRKSRQIALGLGMVAAAAGLLGGVAYLATARAPHPIPIVADSGSRPTAAPEAPTSAPALTPLATTPVTPPVTPDVPIRFKNPFDASEVFEFPAGTSQAEMRNAVAELLAQRARERQSLFVKRPRRNTKTADRNASVTARVTPRS
jgi:hypothetical protein